MDSFTQADAQLLSDSSGTWSASLFLPTHRTGTEMQQDPIRLKNLLREVERQLLAAGEREGNIGTMLKPAWDLLGDTKFWQHQSDGLAVFVSKDHFDYFRVPLPLEELVIVAQRFQLKPLFPLLTGDGHFFILSLSQNGVRFLEATRHGVDEIEVEELPVNLREALNLDDQQRQLQMHTGNAGGGAMFHGHGPGGEYTKEQLEKYFRQVDSAICRFVGNDRAPLVLAGVDYYFPIYRKVSRHPQVLEHGLPGNAESQRPAELHDRAWPIVEQLFSRQRESKLARFAKLHGTGQTSTNLAEVLVAAHDGRVETLFVAADRQVWGTFDAEARHSAIEAKSTAQNEDLLDRATLETYLRGGLVFSVPQATLPAGAELAAIYRW